MTRPTPKPEWLKVRVPGGEHFRKVRHAVEHGRLHTVCQSARCPNQGECWEAGTATFMLLGDVCTRGCRFCAVTRGDPAGVVDRDEPRRVAEAARAMELDYVVLTSVTRDDLPDGGASVFAETVRALKAASPHALVEALVPDLDDRGLAVILDAGLDVLAHNVEVVPRLTGTIRHPRFSYERSLATLAAAKRLAPRVPTKSSLLLGLGESLDEVRAVLHDLRAADTEVLVLGQYLQPTRTHAPVVEYVTPETFALLGNEARTLGFTFVAATPLARTSYRAAEAYLRRARLPDDGQPGTRL